MMKAPTMDPPVSNIIFYRYSVNDYCCFGSFFTLSCCNSQLNLYTIRYTIPVMNMATMSNSPLRTTQSMIKQLQPRLKLVLTSSLPSLTAIRNQSRKLQTLRKLMAQLTRLRANQLLIQQILQQRPNRLMEIQIRMLRMVASTKNSSNRKQQRVRARVCAMASMQMFLSYFVIGLLFSLVMARQPRRKIRNMPKLTKPYTALKKQVKPSQEHCKIVEYDAGWLVSEGLIGFIQGFLCLINL